MSDTTKKIASALAQPAKDAEALALYKEELRKRQSEIAGREVIYKWVSKWVNQQVEVGGPIPIVRDGREVGHLKNDPFLAALGGGDSPQEVATILSARLKEDTPTIKKRLSSQVKLRSALQELLAAVKLVDGMDLAGMEVSQAANLKGSPSAPLEERLVSEVGSLRSTIIGANQLLSPLGEEISRLENEIADRKSGQGRPRKEAAYETALQFAKLFSKVTGERPTYSEDGDGLHGKFTPALRELFDALEPSWRDLSGPARDAQSRITEDDLAPPLNPTLGGLLGVGKLL